MERAEMLKQVQGYDFHHNEVDEELVANLFCDGCGAQPLQYHGFLFRDDNKGSRYRAFCECGGCGQVIEI
jgi:hypothetical protein